MSLEQLELNRRHLLAGMGVGGALLLAGCKSAVKQASGAASAGSTPKSGGTLRAGITQDLIPANILTNSTAGVTTVIGLVYDSLIRYPNDKVTPTPRLATSWQLASDGLSLTLQLREGVTFHSGRPFTSADAAFSLQSYADPVWNGQLESTAQAITKFDTSSPNTLVLHFAHPLGNIFDLLDTVPILDKETYSGLATGKSYIGTGPFKLSSWSPNNALVFTKNDKYWQPGLPYLDGVHVSIVPDATSLTSQIKSGQVDYAYGISLRDIETLSKSSRYQTIRLEGAETQIYVGTNVQAKPLDDIRVRQAIAYALDRDRIISEVFRGAGYPVNAPWPKYSSAYDEQINQTYSLNVAKAKSLVSQVGKIPTIPLTFGTGVPPIASTAAIVQSNLEDVGINVELDPIDNAQFIKQLIGQKFPGLWTTYHSWAQYTPSTLTVSAYPFNASKNASRYSSSKYTADAQGAWKVADGRSSEAIQRYKDLSHDLVDSLFLIEIGVLEPEWLVSGRLKGVSYTKRSEIDLSHAYLA